jgi:hypothetical protein
MKPLYTEEEFNNSKSMDLLPLECYTCGNTFYKYKKKITFVYKHNIGENRFCSHKCHNDFRVKTNNIILNCTNCNKEFSKIISVVNKSNTGNHFYSKSCSASYNNKHKTTGNRRSKLEIYLEQQLALLYPNLTIIYNDKFIIGSELDIYIPSLNLAFELNGIFHYEPIFGIDKLGQIQNNDISKSKACIDNKIDLCIIDTSNQTYVKESTSKKYLDIIIKILDGRLLIS